MKDFSNNPAMAFMSQITEAENTQEELTKKDQAQKPFEPIKPKKEETRSKKKVLLIKPSVFEKLQERAKEYSISTNELINQILEKNI